MSISNLDTSAIFPHLRKTKETPTCTDQRPPQASVANQARPVRGVGDRGIGAKPFSLSRQLFYITIPVFSDQVITVSTTLFALAHPHLLNLPAKPRAPQARRVRAPRRACPSLAVAAQQLRKE